MQQKRVKRHAFFGTFDGANPNLSTATRTSNATPLQGLYLLNDPFVERMGRGLATRLLDHSNNDKERIDLAVAVTFGRHVQVEEVAAVQRLLRIVRRQWQREGVPKRQVDMEAWSAVTHMLLCSNEFFFVE